MAKLLSILLVIGMFATGCGDDESGALAEPESGATVDWADPAVVISLPGGWSIGACQGAGTFLCADRDGTYVGSIEAVFYPVDSFPILDPAADVDTNIRAIADDFLPTMRDDRAVGCGPEYGFSPREYEPATVGGHPGGTFGFVGTMPDGAPSELDLHYVTIVDDEIIMIVASAFDPGGCLAPDEGGSFDTAGLEDLAPHLGMLLAISPLPVNPF